MTTDPAVTAAAEALWVTEHFPVDENDMRLPSRDHPDFVQMEVMTYASAENAVAAARPIIEAEVRERIAAEIEAERDGEPAMTRDDRAYDEGMTDAARIARRQW